MEKLHLDTLTVDSFATSSAPEPSRGTVAAHEGAMRTLSGCPVSWNGTCYISCWDTCYCDTDFC
ncbi:MAG TPA: hypothetical protein VGO40_15145 [Longimicrobium sp.]|nr:hypothetical protein [Longimicrobium sp.]